MRKVLKIISILIFTIAILVSCNNNNPVESSPTPDTTQQTNDPNEFVVPDDYVNPEMAIRSMDNLLTLPRTLRIKKPGGSIYFNASDNLTTAVTDILIKASPSNDESDEDAKFIENYDFTKYDYVLQYSGAASIMVSLENNMYFFEGTKQLYKLYGDSSDFWSWLNFDDIQRTVDLADNPEEYTVLSSLYKHDINGDGSDEDVYLVYKRERNTDFYGNLYLKVGDSEALIYNHMLWQNIPVSSMNRVPSLLFLPQTDSKNVAMVSTLTWATNELGATANVTAFIYEDGDLKLIDFGPPDINFEFEDGNKKYTAEFPQLNKTLDIEFDPENFVRYVGRNYTLKEVLEDKIEFTNHALSFRIADYNDDGKLEIGSMSSLLFEPTLKMSIGTLYTFFECTNDSMTPVKAIIAPPYDDNDQSAKIKIEVYKTIFYYGSLAVDDKGINDANFQTVEEFTSEDIKSTIDELVKDNFLTLKDNKLYIKY
jgi:hypothetical protein